jgi:hypothetical protein
MTFSTKSKEVGLIAVSFNGTTYSIIALPKFKTLEQLQGGLQLVIDLMAEEGQLKKPYPKPEEVIDHSYLQEVTGR